MQLLKIHYPFSRRSPNKRLNSCYKMKGLVKHKDHLRQERFINWESMGDFCVFFIFEQKSFSLLDEKKNHIQKVKHIKIKLHVFPVLYDFNFLWNRSSASSKRDSASFKIHFIWGETCKWKTFVQYHFKDMYSQRTKDIFIMSFRWETPIH